MQMELAGKIGLRPMDRGPLFVAAASAAFSETHVFAAASLFRLQPLVPVEDAGAIASTTHFRVPEPLRRAHHLAVGMRRSHLAAV